MVVVISILYSYISATSHKSLYAFIEEYDVCRSDIIFAVIKNCMYALQINSVKQ